MSGEANRSAAISRRFNLLCACRLIRRVPKSHRYLLEGRLFDAEGNPIGRKKED